MMNINTCHSFIFILRLSIISHQARVGLHLGQVTRQDKETTHRLNSHSYLLVTNLTLHVLYCGSFKLEFMKPNLWINRKSMKCLYRETVSVSKRGLNQWALTASSLHPYLFFCSVLWTPPVSVSAPQSQSCNSCAQTSPRKEDKRPPLMKTACCLDSTKDSRQYKRGSLVYFARIPAAQVLSVDKSTDFSLTWCRDTTQGSRQLRFTVSSSPASVYIQVNTLSSNIVVVVVIVRVPVSVNCVAAICPLVVDACLWGRGQRSEGKSCEWKLECWAKQDVIRITVKTKSSWKLFIFRLLPCGGMFSFFCSNRIIKDVSFYKARPKIMWVTIDIQKPILLHSTVVLLLQCVSFFLTDNY